MGKDHIWDLNRTKDHIWAKTIYGIQHSVTGKPDPKTIGFNTVGTGKPDPKTIYGQRPYMELKPDQRPYGQRPYMGFNTVRQGNRPKDHRIQQGNQTQRPYMGLKPNQRPYMGLKPNQRPYMGLKPNQRPYMGFNTVRQGNRPKDHRIQHSWDRETRPKDHIWAKTIYGIETGPKTTYGQRPYMGFNTVRQGNRTQRP